MIDIAKELNLSILIVAANRLGAINHTLLTIEAIKKRNMKIIGVIYNNTVREVNKIILNDNPRIIREMTDQIPLGIPPWEKDKSLLYKKFDPIGKRLIAALEGK